MADESDGGARRVLVTGFAPYGGRGLNPAAKIAEALDGRTVAGTRVVGRTLPVSYDGIAERLGTLIEEVRPSVAISLGLWPGEAMIRLERFGLNLANFEIPDNDGTRIADEAIESSGAMALRASLPLRAIEQALLADGIPARLSETAGTFLCNVTLYHLMRTLQARSPMTLGGFIHVPYMPEQVALMLGEMKGEQRLELHQRADFASMDLTVQIRAVSLAIATAAVAVGKRR